MIALMYLSSDLFLIRFVWFIHPSILCGHTSEKFLLTLKILRSKFEFSFVAPIHFLQKKWGEVDKISSKFILCDHVYNSHDQCFTKH